MTEVAGSGYVRVCVNDGYRKQNYYPGRGCTRCNSTNNAERLISDGTMNRFCTVCKMLSKNW